MLYQGGGVGKPYPTAPPGSGPRRGWEGRGRTFIRGFKGPGPAVRRPPSAPAISVQRLAITLAFERRCIRSSFVAQVRRTLPLRLHLRALLARRIDALDASGYLRDT